MKKILYLECKTGAAGDMLMGALYGLLTEEQKVLFLEKDRKSTRLNSSHTRPSRMPSSA